MTSGSDFETNSGWAVEFHTGSAQKLHDTEPDFSRRLVRVNEISAPALVLGSTQSNDLIDHRAAAAAGVEIAQRRSGGGVVSMRPGSQCWVDVFIPATDSLWVDDVMLSSSWLGRCWADVATTYGWTAPKVHAGGVSNRRLSRLVCFAALGPGEVSQNSKKLVGISQRRTRHGAKFQCIAYIEWDPSLILDLLQLGSDLEELNQVLVGEVAALPIAGESGSPSEWVSSEWVPAEWVPVERLLTFLP